MTTTIKGLVLGLGAVFGILMSRGAQRVNCHRAGMAGQHPWRCPKQSQRKEVGEGTGVIAQDEATLANN